MNIIKIMSILSPGWFKKNEDTIRDNSPKATWNLLQDWYDWKTKLVKENIIIILSKLSEQWLFSHKF